MSDLVSLNKKSHRNVRVSLDKTDAESAQANLLPLAISECQKAATTLPIVFAKNTETGAFSLVAMTGFEPGENLFFRNNRWDGHYVPLNVRRQPFFAGQDDHSKETILCINESSAALSEIDGERLFGNDGQETEYLKSMHQIVRRLVNELPASQAFAQQMALLNLIVPMNLDIKFQNGEHSKVRGLYTIDDQAASSLSNAQMIELHQSGVLAALYAMVVSLGHIPILIARRNELDGALAELALY